ncbi:MAG: hypothetical protein ACLQU3_26100 [Limisphaerales bacterium]
MPRKLKRHLLNLLRVSGVYVAVSSGIEVARLLMKLIMQDDWLAMVEHGTTVVYFVLVVWFVWRFYTGLYRDGDFWD